MALNEEIIIEVFPGSVDERSGSFKNDAGEDVQYTTRKQAAKLETMGFVYPYEVRLDKGQAAFAPGRYRMVPGKMLTVNKGVHAFSKFAVLEPLPAPSASRAAASPA